MHEFRFINIYVYMQIYLHVGVIETEITWNRKNKRENKPGLGGKDWKVLPGDSKPLLRRNALSMLTADRADYSKALGPEKGDAAAGAWTRGLWDICRDLGRSCRLWGSGHQL